MMCCLQSWPPYDLDLWRQYRNYIFTMNLSLAKLSLLFDIGIHNFGIWVYHHETICCVRSWLLYDLDLWPIGRWQGVSLVSFTHSFNLAVITLQEGIWQSHKLFQEWKRLKWMNIFIIWLMIIKRKSVTLCDQLLYERCFLLEEYKRNSFGIELFVLSAMSLNMKNHNSMFWYEHTRKQ